MKDKFIKFITNQKFIITFEWVVLICALGSIFESGMIVAMKKYEKDYNQLYENYQELYEEYQDYKAHSWVLLG